jgi:hypothetical protein
MGCFPLNGGRTEGSVCASAFHPLRTFDPKQIHVVCVHASIAAAIRFIPELTGMSRVR